MICEDTRTAKKLLSMLYGNKNTKIIKNTDISFDIRIMLNNRIYLIPYLFS